MSLKSLTKNNMLFAPEGPSSNLPLEYKHIFISNNAMRVRLTQINSTLATRVQRSNLISPNHTNSDSEHAMRVLLTQKIQHSPSKSLIQISFPLIVQTLMTHMHSGYT